MKTVKISQQLFGDLVRYHLLDFYDVEKNIKKELEKKMEAYKKRGRRRLHCVFAGGYEDAAAGNL